MLEHDSRIALGVSGGKDSLSLLHILKDLEAERPEAELIVVSIDEGIRGYRDEALRLTEEATDRWGVEWVSIGFRELFGLTMDEIAAMERRLSTCSYCGVLRRRALNEAAKNVEADRLATGHTLDDMAQSAMLNLLRGDINRMALFDPGGRGLQGFVRRIKPLCEVPERESALYAYINNIDFQSIPCPYSEESMRSEVRRYLNRAEVMHPGTKHIVYRTALKIAPEANTDRIRGLCKICGEPSTGTICRVCRLISDLEDGV